MIRICVRDARAIIKTKLNKKADLNSVLLDGPTNRNDLVSSYFVTTKGFAYDLGGLCMCI